MKLINKLSILSLLTFAVPLFSCSKAKEPYNVIKQDADDAIHLTVNADNLPKEIKQGQEVDTTKLIVTYNGKTLSFLGKGNREYQNPDCYFISRNNEYPTSTIVTDLTVNTNVERNDLNFYVSYFEQSENTVYVSKTLTVTVLNDNAIKPWVWFTITGVVIFGVVGMVMFTRYYKNKKSSAK